MRDLIGIDRGIEIKEKVNFWETSFFEIFNTILCTRVIVKQS